MQIDQEKLEELKYVEGRRICYVYEKEHVIWIDGTAVSQGMEDLDQVIDSTVAALRRLAEAGADESTSGIDTGLCRVVDACTDGGLRQWIRDCIS